jgi:hypothetical protein
MKKLTKAQNLLVKQGILLVLIIALSVVCLSVVFTDSPYVTRVGHFIEQPIAFSHETHVTGVGLDCTFCHTGTKENGTRDIPSMETCNGCHQGVLKKAEYLDPVRNAYLKDQPLKWERVNKLADHVHFHHGEHIEHGVACTTCHGDVAQMPLMSPAHHFSMQYCLDCHTQHGPRLKDCFTCHR